MIKCLFRRYFCVFLYPLVNEISESKIWFYIWVLNGAIKVGSEVSKKMCVKFIHQFFEVRLEKTIFSVKCDELNKLKFYLLCYRCIVSMNWQSDEEITVGFGQKLQIDISLKWKQQRFLDIIVMIFLNKKMESHLQMVFSLTWLAYV